MSANKSRDLLIYVDADACPKVIKDILFRAAIRTETKVILIANKRLEIPRSPFITMHQVATGFDVADNEIVLQVTPGDLVVTADIPLADLVIQKGGLALNPRGRLYTKTNIKQYLTNIKQDPKNIRQDLKNIKQDPKISNKTPTYQTRPQISHKTPKISNNT